MLNIPFTLFPAVPNFYFDPILGNQWIGNKGKVVGGCSLHVYKPGDLLHQPNVPTM